ncbi:MAG: Cytochrome c biogenesis ATP-binding export protein CcmA [Steroidobacteraceae bacterium]|nr:Cytochrome c biogenesis ATP-binding export protein CcmA [Steroidobacteraceae bacterium]
MLSAIDLSCIRRDTLLCEGLNFHVGPGQMLQIEGPNGSGKTSLLRTLAGLTPAPVGRVEWNRREIRASAEAFRVSLLWLGHDNAVAPELSAEENLTMLSRLGGEAPGRLDVRRALEEVGLGEACGRAVRTLSQGQRRRVSLARLWCTRKPLWLLDEPLAALDRAATTALSDRIEAHLRSGGMIVGATHHPLSKASSTATLLLQPN